jgi:CelD/BcsL family acetyltransferase involved in cellulose biosynthesis
MRMATAADSAAILEASGGDHGVWQTFGFGEALSRAYREYAHEPRVLDLEDGRRALLPLVRIRRRLRFLRCFESMPFSLTGGLVVEGGRPASPRDLDAVVESLAADSFAARMPPADGEPLPLVAPSRGRLVARSTHVLDLREGFEEIWTRRFEGKVRNQCRLAERKGVQIEAPRSLESMAEYYELYRESAARWGYASPPYPWALFRELAVLLGQGVELKVARVEGRTAAAILLLHGSRTVLYWGAVLRREYASLSPGSLLLARAVEEACGRGARSFDLGASEGLESVRRFKESFGARPAVRHEYLQQRLTSRIVGAAIAVRGRLRSTWPR